MKNLLLILSFLGFLNSAIASDFKLRSNVNSESVNAILLEIETELPIQLKNILNKSIFINFKNLNNFTLSGIDDNCTDHIILGRDSNQFTNNQIEIDNVFIRELDTPNRPINCSHKTIRTYFKATIVHELAHLYDQELKVSSRPLFLNITGWISKGLIVKRRVNLNQLEERSPDRYEYKNNKETFAVNFEHFLYDNNFKCHRPTYFEFYAKTFDFVPTNSLHCENNNKIVITKESGENNSSNSLVRNLNLNRLYQIHYLFAGKGEQAMSQFGHAMFRLVFCAPGREKGPACLNDISYHIVLSFRANIQELTMSYAKGMNGEYPSQLFFIPFTDVIDEYTKGEFREVTSIPLKLSTEEMNRFLLRSEELFWSYRGKYYFFTNNCATEAMNLLRITLGEKDDIQTKNIVTPSGLYQYLIKIHMADTSVLTNLAQAQSQGYYFPSVAQKVFKSLKILGISESDLLTFEKNNKADVRLKLYQEAINNANDSILVAANALRLEDLILHSEEIQFAKVIGLNLFGPDADPKLKETLLGKRINDLQLLYTEISPEHFLTPSYGIPLENEFDTIPQEKIDEVYEKIKAYTEDLKTISNSFFPEQINELKSTMLNRGNLLKIIAEGK